MPTTSRKAYIFTGAVALCAALGVWVGCSKSRPASPPRVVAPVVAQAKPLPPVPARMKGTESGKIKEVFVMLDDKVAGVVRYSEMPQSLKRYTRVSSDGEVSADRYFKMYEYLTALGIDMKKVKAVHVGGTRTAPIDGDELIKFKDSIMFDFTARVEGKPRMRWSSKELRHPVSLDVISVINVYIDKKAPAISDEGEEIVPEGAKVEPPKSGEALPKGTRFYVDGKLMGAVKRRLLSNKLVVNPEELKNTKFSFAAYMESLGVDLAKIKAVDFIARDSLAWRGSAKEFQKKDEVVFTMTNHMKGKVQAHFPGKLTTRVTSVQVYVNTAPPARELDPEAVDDELDPNAPPPPEGEGENEDVIGGENQSGD